MTAHDLYLILPEIIVLLAAVGALIAEMLRSPRLALLVTLAGLLLAATQSFAFIGMHATAFSATYRIDTLSVWSKLVLLPASALCVLLARAELRHSDREGTFYSLISFTTLGALLLAAAGDMLFLVLGVLLSTLGAVALVAYPRNDAATEGAMKLFVFGSVSGAIMIFGLTYWFGATGSTFLNDLARLDPTSLATAVGLVAVIVGLGYKASLVPFHFWAPDAYQGAPVSVAAYLSVVTKIGAIFALAQVLRDVPMASAWPAIIAGLSILTMTYAYLAALVQNDVIRLLAYSSIAQSGYFLLAIVALGRSPLALPSLIVFAAAYAAMNIGAFAVVATTGRTLHTYRGVGRSAPLKGVAMVVFLLSLVGIPPLAGFVGKFLLFGAAIDAHFTALAVVAIINSVLALAVYLRIVVPMYQRAETAVAPTSGSSPAASLTTAVWLIALLLTLAIGLAAQPLLGRLG